MNKIKSNHLGKVICVTFDVFHGQSITTEVEQYWVQTALSFPKTFFFFLYIHSCRVQKLRAQYARINGDEVAWNTELPNVDLESSINIFICVENWCGSSSSGKGLYYYTSSKKWMDGEKERMNGSKHYICNAISISFTSITWMASNQTRNYYSELVISSCVQTEEQRTRTHTDNKKHGNLYEVLSASN